MQSYLICTYAIVWSTVGSITWIGLPGLRANCAQGGSRGNQANQQHGPHCTAAENTQTRGDGGDKGHATASKENFTVKLSKKELPNKFMCKQIFAKARAVSELSHHVHVKIARARVSGTCPAG